jgi:hypothetical protein
LIGRLCTERVWLRASDFVFSQSRRLSDNFPVCGRRAISFSFFLIKVLLIFQSSRHKNRQNISFEDRTHGEEFTNVFDALMAPMKSF